MRLEAVILAVLKNNSASVGAGLRPARLGEIYSDFEFRNTMAHGQTRSLSNSPKVKDAEVDQFLDEWLMAEWQNYCTVENARRTRADIEAVANPICEKCKSNDNLEYDFPFKFGLSSATAALINK